MTLQEIRLMKLESSHLFDSDRRKFVRQILNFYEKWERILQDPARAKAAPGREQQLINEMRAEYSDVHICDIMQKRRKLELEKEIRDYNNQITLERLLMKELAENCCYTEKSENENIPLTLETTKRFNTHPQSAQASNKKVKHEEDKNNKVQKSFEDKKGKT